MPFELLVPTERNARSHFTRIEELAGQIAEHGLLQNLVVRRRHDDTYEVIAGERRRRAIEILRLPTEVQIENYGRVIGTFEGPVPVFISPSTNHDAINLIENICREPLHPWEVGRRLSEWNDAGYDHEWIALHVGKSRSWVHIRITIGRYLSPTVVRALENLGSPEIINTSQLYKLSKLYDDVTQEPHHERQLELFERWLGSPRRKKSEEPQTNSMRVYERAKRLRRMSVPGHAKPYVERITDYLFNPQKKLRISFDWK